MRIFTLLILCLLTGHAYSAINSILPSRNTILLGSIQFAQPVDREIEFPILFKGKEYVAKVESNGDTRKAHFELYDDEKSDELYLLVSEYLALPENSDIRHLCTSPSHSYRLFKLKRVRVTDSNNPKEMLDTWQIEEITTSKKSFEIPDETIIVFMDPEMIEKIQPLPWTHESNVIHFPIIKLKETATKNVLYDMADRMKLSLIDFKFLHKKANLASIPFANNRLLSMPFSTRRGTV